MTNVQENTLMTVHQDEKTSTISPDDDLADVFELAQQLRVDSIRSSTAAGSGHPTSGISAADLMAVLMARHLAYDLEGPRPPQPRPDRAPGRTAPARFPHAGRAARRRGNLGQAHRGDRPAAAFGLPTGSGRSGRAVTGGAR
jgi:hypothetical protein